MKWINRIEIYIWVLSFFELLKCIFKKHNSNSEESHGKEAITETRFFGCVVWLDPEIVIQTHEKAEDNKESFYGKWGNSAASASEESSTGKLRKVGEEKHN